MKITDIVSLAFRTVRGNKLRTGITVAIIAFGIMALVGINTAIDAMKQKFSESFSAMGANGFIIHYKDYQVRMGGRRDDVEEHKKGRKQKKSNINKPITKEEAEAFKQRFDYPSKIGLSYPGAWDAVVSLGSKKTPPNVRVYGGDENYPELNGFSIAAGRDLSPLDVKSGRNVCVLGSDIANKFFGSNPEIPLEKIIKVNNIPFRIIGVLEPKGATMGRSQDNMILTSYNNVRQFFNSNSNASFTIAVKVNDVRMVDGAMGESEGIFRPIRRLALTEDNNFVIDKSDAIVQMLMRNLSFITISAVVIGTITLIGAAVGLMNIMLVSVTERTKEIGLVKAIGGRQQAIRRQFLYESIMISLMGAFFGIVLGIIIGNGFSLVLNTGFVMPYKWLLLGIGICFVTGLLAGLYPAFKASRLNPIEALRYE
ncbi:MAG: ABC transporter permease [Bacteroidetes bacterium]|nr:ABC transporter permease [Bacteroidota bacterium]